MGSAMFYIGPVMGVIITIASLFFVFRFLGGMHKANKEAARVLSTGQPATGQVTAVRQTGTYINNNPQVAITLTVTPQGGAPYQVQVNKVVTMFEIPQYQVGAQLMLRVDPANPMNVAIAGPMQGMPPQGMQQPGMQQPGMQQPGMQQPGMQQPGMQQPGMQQPGMQQPGMQQPGAQQPAPPQAMPQPGAPPQGQGPHNS